MSSQITEPPFPFEHVVMLPKDTAWDGPVGDIVDALDGSIRSGKLDPAAFWHGPRLIRAVIDSVTVVGVDRVALVQEATRFMLDLYAGAAELEQLHTLARNLGAHGLIGARVVQQKDRDTAYATLPESSRVTAEKIAGEDGDVVIVALAHGSVPAAAGVTLFLRNMLPNRSVSLVPIRCSTYKHRDRDPLVDPEEEKMIAQITSGKRVVVFDEDTSSGDGVTRTVAYLQQHLEHPKVVGIANIDHRDSPTKKIQGEWWEHSRWLAERYAYNVSLAYEGIHSGDEWPEWLSSDDAGSVGS